MTLACLLNAEEIIPAPQLTSRRQHIMERVRTLTQAYTQAPWRRQLQILGLFLLALVTVALVAIIYLSVTTKAATVGRHIMEMQADLEVMDASIADLETQLAVMRSASTMRRRAQEMGFRSIEREDIEYLVVDGYTPRQQANMAPAPETVVTIPASLPPDYTESLFDWLRLRLVPALRRLVEVQP
jgi:cell division protein FtsL